MAKALTHHEVLKHNDFSFKAFCPICIKQIGGRSQREVKHDMRQHFAKELRMGM